MIRKHFAAVLIVCVLVETGFVRPLAAEVAPSVSKTGLAHSLLPDCMNSADDIAKIQALQKAYGKTSSKYDGYRNILHVTTDLELAARLAYAETLAANCPTQEGQIVDLVAAVIGNRVRIRHGDVKSVVFQRDQFASSLNIYPESRYRDFLCPSDGALWNKVVAKMSVNLEESAPSAPLPKDIVNYYLYRHGDRFKAPTWKLEEAATPDEKTRECIRVFRDPAWK